MTRSSLKEVRTTEILDAFMSCVERYGLEGSTLEKISEVSGLARPLLRHYLGNRKEMVAKLVVHAIARFDAMTDELIAELPETERLDALMDLLFDDSDRSSTNAAVFQALVTSAHRYDGAREELIRHMNDFEKAITAEIARDRPTADVADCKTVAAGIAAICYNLEAVLPLDPSADWIGSQRRAAERLLEGLR